MRIDTVAQASDRQGALPASSRVFSVISSEAEGPRILLLKFPRPSKGSLASSRSHWQTRARSNRSLRWRTTDKQTNSQRRFTVIELPVFPIVAQSLVLPFKYLPELVKYGGIPFLLSLVAGVISWMIARQDPPFFVGTSWTIAAHFVLFTPFSVTWTKLAIYGREAVATDPPFVYSRTQWQYLLAITAMMLTLVICSVPAAALMRYGQRSFDSQIAQAGMALMLAGLILFAIGFIRLSFVFPALAIRKYAGLSAAWKQTAGTLERLTAIVVLSSVPYLVVRQILQRLIGYHPPGLEAAAQACLDTLLVALATTALAGPALAYKTIVLDEHEDAPALAGTTPSHP